MGGIKTCFIKVGQPGKYLVHWCTLSPIVCYPLPILQVSSLLDTELNNEFIDEIAEEYEDIRSDHYSGLKVINYSASCSYIHTIPNIVVYVYTS